MSYPVIVPEDVKAEVSTSIPTIGCNLLPYEKDLLDKTVRIIMLT